MINTNRFIVGIVLLGASLILGNLLFKDFSEKERIISGALIGAANGAFIGSAMLVPYGNIAGAAIGAAVGGVAGKNYDHIKKHLEKKHAHDEK